MEKITAVLVVTYNRVNLLKENIEALLNQTRNDLDIYIVDNASSDGTAELVENIWKITAIYFITTLAVIWAEPEVFLMG